MEKKVVIVGAGFGGLNAAKILGQNPSDISVTVFDKTNYHLFQPLLYQVATAGLSPAEIAYPIRSILSTYSNIETVLDEIESIDLKNKKVMGKSITRDFDFLILATGASHSYFGHDEWEPFAIGLKTLDQATEIRRRVLLAFEKAELATTPEDKKFYLTFIVVGGGPTGVEMAGALAELSRFTLAKDFKHIDPALTRVILIEAGPRLLNSFSEQLSQTAARDLEKLGVQIWTSSRVTHIDQSGIKLEEEFIRSATKVWAAGVQPSILSKTFPDQLDKLGRIKVKNDLSVENNSNVFVVGDLASFQLENKTFLPGLAPVAMQQGRHAAKNILCKINQKPTTAFRYNDKGQMATIGRSRAVAESKGLKFTGFIAWMMWLVIHIYYLIGVKNKLFVIFDWSWAYLTYRRGARLIIDKK